MTLPDIRQTDDYGCGAACVDALCLFHKVAATGGCNLANVVQGLSPDTAEALLRRAGLVVLSGTMGVADLKHLTKTGRPVMCPTALYGGHWVVVTSVTPKRVYYHCPANGPCWVSASEWLALWYDTSRYGHDYKTWGVCPYRSDLWLSESRRT